MANLKNTSVVNSGDFKLPAGTNAQRPSNAQQGMLRFNTDAGVMEVYDGTQWDTTSPPYKYYDEDRFASVYLDNWDDNTVRYMDRFGGFGQAVGHGWTNGPVNWNLRLNNLPPHMYLKFFCRAHLIDSIDNENNRIYLNDDNDNLFQIIDFERDFDAPIFTTFIAPGVSFSASGRKPYSFHPYSDTTLVSTNTYNSYAEIDSGYYYHTRSNFRAYFDINVQQDVDDEAFYLTHCQVWLK